jgi:hypothetical protein
MPTTRLFAYNTGSPISGTTQVGSIAISESTLLNYSQNAGGVRWWNGPDEDLGYVITHTTPSGTQPNRDGVSAYIGFWRSSSKTENSLISLTNSLFRQNLTSGSDCKTYLNNNGYWTSWVGGSSFDPDAQAFITAAGITNPTQQTAINQLVLDLKSYSIWSSMIAIYPFVGGSATSHMYNLKGGSFTLSFNGGWTHTSTGALPNGTNAYADTGISPFSTLGSSHNYSVYSRTNNTYPGNTIGSYELGGYICGENGFIADLQLLLTTGGNYILVRDGVNGNYAQFSNTSTLGYFTVNRNSNTLTAYKNGTSIGSSTFAQALPSTTIALSAAHVYDFDCGTDYYTEFDNKEFAFATLANSSLSSTNIANLNTAVQSFQTTLGRQV